MKFGCNYTTRIRQYPSNTTYLFIIRVSTCFDPTGSSSGLHYEPVDVKKLRTFMGSQTMFTIVKYEKFVSNGLHMQDKNVLYLTFVNIVLDPKNVRSFLTLTLRRLMSYIYIYIYIYMEHPFLMFLDHKQRRSTVGRTPLDE